jgi:hypothetical protein
VNLFENNAFGVRGGGVTFYRADLKMGSWKTKKIYGFHFSSD